MREITPAAFTLSLPPKFSRMHLNTWLNVPEKKGIFQYRFLVVVEKDHHKDLPLRIGSWLCKFARSCQALIGSSSSIRTLL